jgi:hypothetical protein|tara:strand:+ start:852 stop:1439 length:588 start_codon:yes stop_codon:yes gene_type:complete
MQVSVKSNIKEITKWTTNAQKKQIPFATSVAINNTLFDLKKEMAKQMDKKLDRPTPFTKRGFFINKAKKNLLVGVLLMKDIVANYMHYQIEGGTRQTGKRIPVPYQPNARLNKFGNIIGKKTGLIKKSTQFMGTVGGTEGVYERTKDGLKLIIGFERSVNYTPRFPFYIIASKFSNSVFDKNFTKAFNRALKSAK